MKRIIFLIVLCAMPFCILTAGDLDDFEEGISKPDTSDDDSYSSSDDGDESCSDAICSTCGELLCYMGMEFMALLGENSMEKAGAATPSESDFSTGYRFTPRNPGDLAVPVLRVDADYHVNEIDLHAADFRLEAGFGAFSAALSLNQFMEFDESDTLTYGDAHIYFRLMLIEQLQIDLGIGACFLSGNDTQGGFSLDMPIRLFITPTIGLEIMPGARFLEHTEISDTELAVILGHRGWYFRGGFRLFGNESSNLSGPFAGVTWCY